MNTTTTTLRTRSRVSHTRALGAAASLALATTAACGAMPGGGPGDASAPLDAPSATDAPVTPPRDAGRDAATPPPDVPTTGGQGGGFVTIAHRPVVSMGTVTTVAGVSVAIQDTTGSGLTCTDRMEGSCRVSVCTDPGMPVRYANAGTVNIAGRAGNTVAMRANPDGSYTTLSEDMRRWQAGEMLTVSAVGARVPPFETTLTFPAPITLTSPMVMPGPTATIALDRAMGLATTWTGGDAAGTVRVAIEQAVSQPGGGAREVSIACSFPAASGAGMVPPAALADLMAVPLVTSVYISAADRREVMAGGYALSVSAVEVAITAIGSVR